MRLFSQIVTELLALRGHTVDVYEARPKPGGLLYYGIPGFKLEKDAIEALVQRIEKLGIFFICNTRVNDPGQPTVEDLLASYDAVLLAIGAGVPSTMGIPGEEYATLTVESHFEAVLASN